MTAAGEKILFATMTGNMHTEHRNHFYHYVGLRCQGLLQPPFFLAILQLYGMMLVKKYNGELIV